MLRHPRLILFVLISGALTLWIASEITGFERSVDRYQLSATFDDATNLGAGDPVKLAGVRVGTVAAVELVTGRAVVSFGVDRGVDLPVDSLVSVQAQDLLGRRLLRLDPGSDDAMLDDGDEMENTASAVHLGDLINELGPLLEAVRPEQVNSLVSALNDAVTGNRETIAGITNDLATVLDTAASRSDTIASLVDDYGVLAGEVANRDQSIQRLLDNLVRLTETFEASEDVLVEALDTIPGTTDALRSLLVDNATQVDSILADLAAVTESLQPSLDDVDLVLAGLPTVLEKVWSVIDDGRYIKINFSCVAASPPPCPHPVVGQTDTPEDASLGETLLGVLGL
ncbi:MCE family protein [Actinospongicola halichondriae]|uniref:MCE family protein n=1 Tax=Actinospongicola halichondriae TaxID=3236844 RepID=UPI003D380189